jgi:hypothetical protein
MEISDGAYAIKPIAEGCKGGGLWEEHEQSIQTFEKIRILFWFEEL